MHFPFIGGGFFNGMLNIYQTEICIGCALPCRPIDKLITDSRFLVLLKFSSKPTTLV